LSWILFMQLFTELQPAVNIAHNSVQFVQKHFMFDNAVLY